MLISGALGMLVEWALIRHLYKRPLDTLLDMGPEPDPLQQAYRSISAPMKSASNMSRPAQLPAYYLRQHRDSDQRRVRDDADILDHDGGRLCHVQIALGPPGPRRRAKPHHGRLCRNQYQPLHLRTGCGIAGIAGNAFTIDWFHRTDFGPALHRRHLPGGRVQPPCSAPSPPPSASLADPVDAMEFFLAWDRWRRSSRCSPLSEF